VAVGALHTTELGDKYLRTSHLKTVDNVDDFHGLGWFGRRLSMESSAELELLLLNLQESFEQENPCSSCALETSSACSQNMTSRYAAEM